MAKLPELYNIGANTLQTVGIRISKAYLFPGGTDSQSQMLTSPTLDGVLHWNGSGIPHSEPVALASGVLNMMVMNQADYDALSPKNSTTLYFIT